MTSAFLIVAAVLVAVVVLVIALRRRGGTIDREAYLIVKTGSRMGLRFQLVKGKTMIGSQEDNDLVLTDARISRHHLMVSYERRVFLVKDLNSLYGTFMDGKRIEKQAVSSGETINLGEAVELELSVLN